MNVNEHNNAYYIMCLKHKSQIWCSYAHIKDMKRAVFTMIDLVLVYLVTYLLISSIYLFNKLCFMIFKKKHIKSSMKVIVY